MQSDGLVWRCASCVVLLLYFWKESKGFRCSCRPVGSCMLMAWLVCDFEIKASLILVRAGLKAVS